MTTKHTPGPWRVRRIPDDSGRFWIDSRAEHRGKLTAGTLAEMMREFEPDQADYDDGQTYSPPAWLVLASNAIAKAKGCETDLF